MRKPSPTGQPGAVNTPPPTSAPPVPSTPDGVRERLDSMETFRRCYEVAARLAWRWLAHAGVPAPDRDDVFHDAVLEMWRKRATYDPEIGSWEDWAFGYVGQVARTYRRAKGRRVKREDVAFGALPDVAVEAPSPQQEAEASMMEQLLEKCLAGLDQEARMILFARAEGRGMPSIAVAIGVSLATAYRRHDAARAKLQAALDREQAKTKALGVAVLPLTVDQLLASDRTASELPAETMERLWKALAPVMATDVEAGSRADDGVDVQSDLGPPETAPRPSLGARALRALSDPRVSHAVAAVISAAGGAAVTYQIMRGPADRPHDSTADAREAAAASVVRLLGPAPLEAPSPELPAVAGAAEPRAQAGAAELRPGAGLGVVPALAGAAELRPGAAPAASGVAREDITKEQAIFEKGSTAYQEDRYSDAIEAFRAHASEHPRGRFAAARDRLLTLALIRTGRKAEARQRIEQLRRANPQSATVKELEAALSPAN